MRRSGSIVSYTLAELEEMRARGESLTDWAKVDSFREEELEHRIAEDGEEGSLLPGWDDVLLVRDGSGQHGKVTLAADLVEWFLRNHQSDARRAMERVLRQHVESQAARRRGADVPAK
jgi:hypothetical protein